MWLIWRLLAWSFNPVKTISGFKRNRERLQHITNIFPYQILNNVRNVKDIRIGVSHIFITSNGIFHHFNIVLKNKLNLEMMEHCDAKSVCYSILVNQRLKTWRQFNLETGERKVSCKILNTKYCYILVKDLVRGIQEGWDYISKLVEEF